MMPPLIVIDHGNPSKPPKYPDRDGPTKAPRADDELKNPDIIPYV